MNSIFELYQVDEKLYQLIDPETGELLDEGAFAALMMERADLIENLILWYKNTVAEFEAVKKEADALVKRQRAISARADGLKERIDYFLNGQRFQTPRCTARYHRSEAVSIQDEDALIEWAERGGFEDFLRYKKPEVNKRAVKARLKLGKCVPGASLEERRSVVIS